MATPKRANTRPSDDPRLLDAAYQEVGHFIRWYATWRQALVAGAFALFGGALYLRMEAGMDTTTRVAGCVGCAVAIAALYLFDRRNRHLVDVAHTIGARLEQQCPTLRKTGGIWSTFQRHRLAESGRDEPPDLAPDAAPERRVTGATPTHGTTVVVLLALMALASLILAFVPR